MKSAELKNILVTGGTGFVGAALVKHLVESKYNVTVFDNNSRGNLGRLNSHLNDIKYINGDITNFDEVCKACENINTIFHLAFINGTENFYKMPDKVLEVGVKGAINILDAAKINKINNFIVTSSSEVYQQPTKVPTDENERIIIPDILNPRFSYSGAKIITELLTLHYLKNSKIRTVICRPHNFYGPDMGNGHVIPQFINKIKLGLNNLKNTKCTLEIEGTGNETRSFCYINDAINGLMLSAKYGKSGEIYNIGSSDEIEIKKLAILIAKKMNVELSLKFTNLRKGGTNRRCPNLDKITKFNFKNLVNLDNGLDKTIKWYLENPLEFENNDFIK